MAVRSRTSTDEKSDALMARKLRPLSDNELDRLPASCADCAFWESAVTLDRRCGSACDVDLSSGRLRTIAEEWGECGRVAYEDDEVLGFIKYGPSRYFPQASTFASAPLDGKVPLITCLHVEPNARHHGLGSVLLRSALRDLALRGERRVEAFAAADKPAVLEESPVLGIDFLLRNGFTVSRPDPKFPLLKLDLRSLAMIGENLESVFESLRFPMRVPKRVPASWSGGPES